MACAICGIRKPRRFCPGVHGDICTLCCGNEREVTVDCPFDCTYLQEARKHEHTQPVNPDTFPNQDIRIKEEFLEEHEALLAAMARILLDAALDTSGTVDIDMRDALDALVRTYRTMQSGVLYESRPVNALAGQIFDFTQKKLEEYREAEREKLMSSRTRDSDVLLLLVFLQRLELDRNNGRPRGRAFMDFLRGFFSDEESAIAGPHASSLIVP
ncbi:MAG TPA: hypothetical protein VKR61_11345 [Bryobacteraceae bacterium]|nr:hypothetical protein [Bryobacteraceae bacterium]